MIYTGDEQEKERGERVRGGEGGGGGGGGEDGDGGGGRLKSVRETSAVEARNGDTATRRDDHICRRPMSNQTLRNFSSIWTLLTRVPSSRDTCVMEYLNINVKNIMIKSELTIDHDI
ncbi:hypothetical protein V1478_004546 [Vespula squamosa]|uniref:Uncharacterized protein n=1 Tax=Vespula squamosa TaxID=30214 RepID=A0ABD2BGH4_VESSQ